MRRFLKNLPWVELLVLLAVVGALGHCGYVYATCEGKVLKGFFDQPVCVKVAP